MRPFKCMVAIGDSITMGAAATKPEYSWVSRLGCLLTEFQDRPVRTVNAGISGNLLSPRSRAYNHADSGRPSGVERCKRDVLAYAPDLVAVSYGLNDMRCGTPIGVFMSDMERLVREIRQGTPAVIVLLGVYYMTAYQRYGDVWGHGSLGSTRRWNQRLRRFAAAQDLVFVDVYAAQGEAGWAIDNDGVHPNNLGHAMIAHKVFEAIAARCQGLSLKCRRDAEAYPRWADPVEAVLRTYDGIEQGKHAE